MSTTNTTIMFAAMGERVRAIAESESGGGRREEREEERREGTLPAILRDVRQAKTPIDRCEWKKIDRVRNFSMERPSESQSDLFTEFFW